MCFSNFLKLKEGKIKQRSRLSRHESTLRLTVCVHQGKTLTTIALILTNFHKGKPLPVEKCVSVAVRESFSKYAASCSTVTKRLFTRVQEEQASPVKGKTKPQTASKLEGNISVCLSRVRKKRADGRGDVASLFQEASAQEIEQE